MPSRKQELANPAALGLMAFGFTTILLSLVNMDIVDATLEASFVLTMGIFFGGFGQLLAGWVAFRRGEMFPATVFTAYGIFWESLAFYWVLVAPPVGIASVASGGAIASFMLIWGIFTLLMWVFTFYHTWNLVFVFGTLWITFFLLGAHPILESEVILKWAGGVGLICGALAVWTGFGLLFLDHTGRKLPGMGRPLR